MPEQTGPGMKIAVIGSFKQHYAAVRTAIEAFRAAGWTVTSPAGADVMQEGIDFVRFTSDDPEMSDAAVQSLTLLNIFAADLVYVVAPDGYVGRTTCYEIGRLVQAGRPVFVSHHPVDLPVAIPERFVVSAADLIAGADSTSTQQGWWDEGEDHITRMERELVHVGRR
jgi:hypothetical protein